MKPSEKVPTVNPLVIQNCPDLTLFPEDSVVNMGDLLNKLLDVSGQYNLCKKAALQGTK